MQCTYTADTAYDAFCNYNCTGSIHSPSYTSLPAARAQLCCTASADSESLSQQRTQLHNAQFSPTVIQEPGNHCHRIRTLLSHTPALRHAMFLSHRKIWYTVGCHEVWLPLHLNIQILLNF